MKISSDNIINMVDLVSVGMWKHAACEMDTSFFVHPAAGHACIPYNTCWRL